MNQSSFETNFEITHLYHQTSVIIVQLYKQEFLWTLQHLNSII